MSVSSTYTHNNNTHVARFSQSQMEIVNQRLEFDKAKEELQKTIDKQATVINKQAALIDAAKEAQQGFVLIPATHACTHP